MMMIRVLAWLRWAFFVIGLAIFFAAERYYSADGFYAVLWKVGLGVAALGLLLTIAVAFLAKRDGLMEESRSWRWAALWQAIMLAGCGVYIAYIKVLGTARAPETLVSRALLVGWLSMLILGIAMGIGVEWARIASGRGVLAESRRISRAAGSWSMAGLLLCSLVAINYAAHKKDRAFDWSYLKTTKASQATARMLGTLGMPLNVVVFFPTDNEVRPFVKEYVDALPLIDKKIQVQYFDKDLHPTQAEKYRVSRNGQVILEYGDKQERIDLGTKLAGARASLKRFDTEFQKAFLAATAAKKVAYFTRGHGELSWVSTGAKEPLESLKVMDGFLRDKNYSLRVFGAGEGSATEVPKDASVVVIIGPDQPFMPAEVAVLRRYLLAGGRVLLFADMPKVGSTEVSAGMKRGDDPLFKMLEEFGIKMNFVMVANDRNFVRAENSPSDHWILFSNIFTSHESVSNLARNEERLAVVGYQTGYLSVAAEVAGWKNTETIKTLSDTFDDLNRDFTFQDKAETRASYAWGAAGVYKPADPAAPEGRLMVFSDANIVSDALLQLSRGNLVMLYEAIKWLAGESSVSGTLTSEEDVKILHTRKEDMVWFYGSVVLVPLMLLAAGFMATRRRDRKKVEDHAA